MAQDVIQVLSFKSIETILATGGLNLGRSIASAR